MTSRRRIRQPLASQPGYTSTLISESRPSRRGSRLERGTNQSTEPTGRWNGELGPCETGGVTGADSGAQPAQPVTREERIEHGDERVENCKSVGEGGEEDLDSCAKRAPISDLER
jgi:hypothetical protein